MKIKVENFQSIKKSEVEIEGLTVITGQNNIGKSALARAVGGLFSNLRGNSFVRRGEKYCTVEIKFDDTNEVLWEKGKSKNNYTINGKSISKVGSSAPVEIEQFKIVPVLVDGKEIWPQIAKQFEQIFLLNLPPSAISSALSDVEKIQKLENASALARKDVRDIRSRLKVKREDLETSNQFLDCFSTFDTTMFEQIKKLEVEIAKVEKKLEVVSKLSSKRDTVEKLIEILKESDVDIPTEDFSEYESLPNLVSLNKRRKKNYLIKSSISFSLRGLEIKDTLDIEEIADKINSSNRLLSKRTKLEKLKTLSEELNDIEIPTSEIPEDISPMKIKKQKLEHGISVAKEEVKKIDSELKDLHDHVSQGVCPLCLRGNE